MSKSLNAKIARANAPSLVAAIMQEPIVLSNQELNQNVITTSIASGGSLYARRQAFALARGATGNEELAREAFKIGDTALKIAQRDNCPADVAETMARALRKRSVVERTATKFDATRNENHIYVSAGTALNQMEVDTGFKDAKPSAKKGATTIEAIVKKDEKVTPSAATHADIVAWFTANALIVAKYIERNKATFTGEHVNALALCGKTFADSVANVNAKAPKVETPSV
jgi:hypothetical protein